jgi:Ribbon-helix-helix protein, copG family
MSNQGATNHMGEDQYTDIERHAGQRAGIVVSVRLKPDEAELLRALSERDGRSLSETLRVALHAFSQQSRATPLRPDQVPMTRGHVFVQQPDRDLILT